MWLRTKSAVVLGCAVLLACSGAERAIRVTVIVRTPADDVCLTAAEEGTTTPNVVFATAYPVSTLPMPATLTFVAGSGFMGPVDVSARGVLAGTFVGGATVTTSLATQGTSDATLPVERCRARTAAGFGTRPAGTFAALHDPPRTIAADYDADGRDELLAIAADGSLVLLDAEMVNGGSRRTSDLVTMDGALVRAGDLDGNCRADIIAAAASGALVVSSSHGESPPPVGTAPRDVAIGRVSRAGPIRLVMGGASGLSLASPPGGTGATVMLTPHPIDHVVTWDADGDGGTEIVATGTMGLLAYATMMGVEMPMTIPGFDTFHGPVAVGDLDDDGDTDLVVADVAALHLARRAASTFLDASGSPATSLDSAVARLIVADVDGDCGDDVIALSHTGVVSVFRLASPDGLMLVGMMTGALDFSVGDFDGDGSKEIALIGTGGRVTLWQP